MSYISLENPDSNKRFLTLVSPYNNLQITKKLIRVERLINISKRMIKSLFYVLIDWHKHIRLVIAIFLQ